MFNIVYIMVSENFKILLPNFMYRLICIIFIGLVTNVDSDQPLEYSYIGIS